MDNSSEKNTHPAFSVREEVRNFSPYVPGLSIDEIRIKYGLSQVIKMASNESPLGASPLVQKAVISHAGLAFRYPQAGNPRLCDAIARNHRLKPEQVVVGNGSDEIIDLLIRLRGVPGKSNILTFSPCFSIYSLQTRFAGLELRQVPLDEDFSFPLHAFLDAADDNTVVAFVTAPDNPSGYTPSLADLLLLVNGLPDSCVLVVDEAYMDFCDNEEAHSLLPQLDSFPNLVICRTFSKSYGLAGLRLGYGLMHPTLADYLHRVRLPFSVNVLAEEAGLAALADVTFRKSLLDVVRKGRIRLKNGLEELGCKVWPSHANFLMFALPESATLNALQFFEIMLSRGIIIRPLKSYGMPDKLRVSMGSDEENNAFLKAAAAILSA